MTLCGLFLTCNSSALSSVQRDGAAAVIIRKTRPSSSALLFAGLALLCSRSDTVLERHATCSCNTVTKGTIPVAVTSMFSHSNPQFLLVPDWLAHPAVVVKSLACCAPGPETQKDPAEDSPALAGYIEGIDLKQLKPKGRIHASNMLAPTKKTKL